MVELELNWLLLGGGGKGCGVGNPLVSWSSCEFDLKERRERGCDWCGDVCQIISTKFKTSLLWFEDFVTDRLGRFEYFFLLLIVGGV